LLRKKEKRLVFTVQRALQMLMPGLRRNCLRESDEVGTHESQRGDDAVPIREASSLRSTWCLEKAENQGKILAK
jgi:hypothetical protein